MRGAEEVMMMRLIPLLLIVVLAGSFLWWSRGRRIERPDRKASASPLPPDLARWVGAGLVSKEQADAIVAFEEREVSPRKVPLLTEALGYVGAVLAIAGGSVALGQVWEDLGDGEHVAVVGAAAVVSFAGGWLIRSQDEPAMQRLMSVLWALSVGGFVGATTLLFVDVVDLSVDARVLTIGGIGAVYAATLWWFQRRVLQQVVLFGTCLATVMGFVLVLPGDAAGWVFALAVWGAGGVWLLLGWYGVVTPTWAAIPLGALAGVWGPSVGAGEHGWLLGLGLVSAALLMSLAVTGRKLPLLAIGAVGSFAYLTASVVRYFGDTLGIPLALALVGGVVLAIAVVLGRAGPFGGGGWHRPAGHSV